MNSLQLINDLNEINSDNEWELPVKLKQNFVNRKGKTVSEDYAGRRYEYYIQERKFSNWEVAFNVMQSSWTAITSLGSQSLAPQNLFLNKHVRQYLVFSDDTTASDFTLLNMPDRCLPIFSFLKIEDLVRSQAVNKQWRTLASHESLLNILNQKMKNMFFCQEKWTQYFRIIERLQPPKNIISTLNSPCPIWPGKKIKDTHIPMLIPESIDGEKDILVNFSDLIKVLKDGYGSNISIDLELLDILRKHHQSQPAHWVLMTKYSIPGSRNKTYVEQKTLVQDLAQMSKTPYEIPTVLDAVICIYMNFVNSGIRLFNETPENYTRCQPIDFTGVIIGNFSLKHLNILPFNSFSRNSNIGVAALRKLE